jgi:pimeloyl-ACP methyl ester carboxylesterase
MRLPPIVLIPGLLCDETVWNPVAKELRKSREVVIADLSTQEDIRQMASDLLVLNSGELHVAGHSMGARVAMEMAHQAPERVTRLALFDTGMHPLKDGEPKKRQKTVEFAYDNGMEALCDQWLPPMVHPGRHGDKDLMGALRDMVQAKEPDLHARQIKALVNRPDASSYVAGIACPTLLVVGRQDQWSPVKQHEDMLRVFPNAKLVIVEEAGHFAPIEQPEFVAMVLAEWLL